MKPKLDHSPPRPTLKTIAFMTGLAATTVSRALNDAPDINSSTKERVRLVATQIGYKADRAGLRLRTGKTRTVAFVLNIEEEILGIMSPLMAGATEVLTPAGYSLIVIPETPDQDPMTAIESILDDGLADGIIFTRTRPDDRRVAFLDSIGFAFATHGRTSSGIQHPYHDFDNAAYAYESVRLLSSRGRRRLALLPPPRHLTFFSHMSAGYKAGLADFGCTGTIVDSVDLDSPLPAIFDLGSSTGHADAHDGIIIGGASAAIAFLAGAESAGKKALDHFDIVGKEPADFLEWIRPEILTFNEDIKLAGNNLAKAVIARMRGEPIENLQTVVFPTRATKSV
jgi:LacI family transcriptional regulator